MGLDMKKNIKSSDKISEPTLHEILLDIKYRLDHLEDILYYYLILHFEAQ